MPNSAKQGALILAVFALDGPTNGCQHVPNDELGK